jgi:hypothetical protein
MSIRCTLIFMAMGFSFLSNVRADVEPYFYPILYQSLWPDFCLEHLSQFPESCSEQTIDGNGCFHSTFSQEGASAAHIDKEILARLSNAKDFIPPNSQRCDFRFCATCHSPVSRGVFLADETDEWYDEDEEVAVVCYRCRCVDHWHGKNDWDDYEEDDSNDHYKEFKKRGWPWPPQKKLKNT